MVSHGMVYLGPSGQRTSVKCAEAAGISALKLKSSASFLLFFHLFERAIYYCFKSLYLVCSLLLLTF